MYTQLTFAIIGNSKPVLLAQSELLSYLKRMDTSIIIECRSYSAYDENVRGVIWLGITGDIAYSDRDEILIDTANAVGRITGSNERSVLIAAYRFLYELGCRFYRFEKDCEKVPKREIKKEDLNIHVSEKASYKHRAVCIEGAVSYEHVYNIIQWLPKVGLNGYYVQFQKPHTFFERWYSHASNPALPAQHLTNSDVLAMYRSLVSEIKARGLMYHAVGHGWTCEPLGLDGNGWYKQKSELPKEKSALLAEVNGERRLWNGIPLNTNLCYSNPKVREIITDAIVSYLKENPDVDYLHFWLADDKNNQCECDECKKQRPSDFYVMMLNLLDKKLTAEGIKTKIVFLVYYDLLWKPEHTHIENPDRFVLMFAPISRTYSTAFSDIDTTACAADVPEYERNRLIMPKNVASNIAFLKSWQTEFKGDSFDFDYHLMWDHVRDVGYFECARILHTDMCNLDKIGLDGMVSCQLQRAAFPTNLPMYAMARGLWNKRSDFEAVADEYFTAEFENDSDKVKEYMRKLSSLVEARYFRKESEKSELELLSQFKEALQLMDNFKVGITPEKREIKSWNYIYHHAKCTRLIILALIAELEKNYTEKEKQVSALAEYVRTHELEIHHALDVWNYLYVISRILDCNISDLNTD